MKFRFVLLGPDDEPNGQPAEEGAASVPGSPCRALRYEQRGADIVRLEQLGNGRSKSTPVANFNARIVRDILLDDGDQERREFGVEAELEERRVAFTMSAAEFGRMGWVLNKLGPQAIIYPGQHQHARAAIQYLSGPIRREVIFTHMGWRKYGLAWFYLHAGGAICAGTEMSEVGVQLPAALQEYKIRQPDNASELIRAIRTSLQLLALAPDRVSFPLLAAVFRAVLGKADFSLFLVGRTGVFKTALAALCQQFFGPGLDAANLPGNFASTEHAVTELAFHAKDAVFVVDDFAPTGGHGDGEQNRVAERLFRSAGNQQGRSRLTKTGQLNTPKSPRALVLATGEQTPAGQSIRARLLMLEVAAGDVDQTKLGDCQEAARLGYFSVAMGGYLAWLAGRFEDIQCRLRSRARDIRNEGLGRRVHARLPSALAELEAGWEIFLEFAQEAGALDPTEKEELQRRNRKALTELAALQAKHQEAADPVVRFLTLLKVALEAGGAHVADRQGRVPRDGQTWGWRRNHSGRGWEARGARIGWVSGGELFLDSAASYEAAQSLAGTARIALSEQSLRQKLRERGFLASTDVGRGMVQVRRTLEGKPRQVLHLKPAALLGP